MNESGSHPSPTAQAGAVLAGPPQSRRDRLLGPLVTGGIVGGLTLALHFRDPHTSGSWGACPWLALTGQYCPGCGGLRAINDLTNGDIVAAASSNLLLVALVPVLILCWMGWTRRAWTGAPGHTLARRQVTVLVAACVLVTVVFSVLRNLPAGSWLAP